ncbi:hypothetical protein CDAR_18371 [Caerostris darwini]|uniref:Uncharacterized protein n=1 Tax=Caerostris darwini TaxID=1538125 RepID=A0AAV4V8X7_9ARAC|nr:hypothetical protein CDAR_18371 [Caerostris darwini]
MPSCFARIRETKTEHPEPRDKIPLKDPKTPLWRIPPPPHTQPPPLLRKLFFSHIPIQTKVPGYKNGRERERKKEKQQQQQEKQTLGAIFPLFPRSKDVVRLSSEKKRKRAIK